MTGGSEGGDSTFSEEEIVDLIKRGTKPEKADETPEQSGHPDNIEIEDEEEPIQIHDDFDVAGQAFGPDYPTGPKEAPDPTPLWPDGPTVEPQPARLTREQLFHSLFEGIIQDTNKEVESCGSVGRFIAKYKRDSLSRIIGGSAASLIASTIPGADIDSNFIRYIMSIIGGATAGSAINLKRFESGLLSDLKEYQKKDRYGNTYYDMEAIKTAGVLETMDSDKLIKILAGLSEVASMKGLQINSQLHNLEKAEFEAKEQKYKWLYDKKAAWANLGGFKKLGYSAAFALGLGAAGLAAGVMGIPVLASGAAAIGIRSGIQIAFGMITSQVQYYNKSYENTALLEEIQAALLNKQITAGMELLDISEQIQNHRDEAYIASGKGAAVGAICGAGVTFALQYLMNHVSLFHHSEPASNGTTKATNTEQQTEQSSTGAAQTTGAEQHNEPAPVGTAKPTGAEPPVPPTAGKPEIDIKNQEFMAGQNPKLHVENHYFYKDLDHKVLNPDTTGPHADKKLAEIIMQEEVKREHLHFDNHAQYLAARDHMAEEWREKGFFNTDGSLKNSPEDIVQKINGIEEAREAIHGVASGEIKVPGHEVSNSGGIAHAGERLTKEMKFVPTPEQAFNSAQSFDSREQLDMLLDPKNGYLSADTSTELRRLLDGGQLKYEDFKISISEGHQFTDIKIHLPGGDPSREYIGHQLLKPFTQEAPVDNVPWWQRIFGHTPSVEDQFKLNKDGSPIDNGQGVGIEAKPPVAGAEVVATPSDRAPGQIYEQPPAVDVDKHASGLDLPNPPAEARGVVTPEPTADNTPVPPPTEINSNQDLSNTPETHLPPPPVETPQSGGGVVTPEQMTGHMPDLSKIDYDDIPKDIIASTKTAHPDWNAAQILLSYKEFLKQQALAEIQKNQVNK